MEGLPLEALGGGGVIVALVVAIILWRFVKLAVKIVVFLVVTVVLAAGVALYLKHGAPQLPTPDVGRGLSAPPGDASSPGTSPGAGEASPPGPAKR